MLDKRFPGVVQAIASLDGAFVLDGELVALDSHGKPSFKLLQYTMSQLFPIYFYAFNLLNENGQLLVALPLSSRRQALESLLAAPKDPLRLSPLLQAPLGEVFEAVRRLGLEGVVGLPRMNPASAQARGSSFARTWSKSSLSAATSLEHAASMRCSQVFAKANGSFLQPR